MHHLGRTVVTAVFGALACALCAADLGPGLATRVSLGTNFAEGDNEAYEGAISNNGKIVAFYSNSTNVHPDATAGEYQIFVRDLRTGGTELISVDGDGNEGTSYSYYPGISANGRKVVYYTAAANIASEAPAEGAQVVLFDRRTGESTVISRPESGDPADGDCNLYDCRPMSANGRWIVFHSTASNLAPVDMGGDRDIFLYDSIQRTVERISLGIGGEANGNSNFPSISPNGRWIVYTSEASNLVPDDMNGQADVFLYDRVRRTTEIVSLADNEAAGDDDAAYSSATISNNGRWVAFLSRATNLVSPNDVGTINDLFLRDRRLGTTTKISVGPAPDFEQGSADCGTPAITPNGRYITYWTYASNMIEAADTIAYDQIIYDTRTGTARRVIERLGGGDSGGVGNYGYWNQMSANGRWYVITTDSGLIEAGDMNGEEDVFLVDLK